MFSKPLLIFMKVFEIPRVLVAERVYEENPMYALALYLINKRLERRRRDTAVLMLHITTNWYLLAKAIIFNNDSWIILIQFQ